MNSPATSNRLESSSRMTSNISIYLLSRQGQEDHLSDEQARRSWSLSPIAMEMASKGRISTPTTFQSRSTSKGWSTGSINCVTSSGSNPTRPARNNPSESMPNRPSPDHVRLPGFGRHLYLLRDDLELQLQRDSRVRWCFFWHAFLISAMIGCVSSFCLVTRKRKEINMMSSWLGRSRGID